MLKNGATQSFPPLSSLSSLSESMCLWWSLTIPLHLVALEGFDTCWGYEVRLSFLGGITENYCWGFDVKDCRDVKEPSRGNDTPSLLYAVLHSVQSSCKCVIWMSVQWAHYLYRKHLCFQVTYFQKAVLLLALYSSSLSSMKKTRHEKSLCFSLLHWNNFVLLFLKGVKAVTTLTAAVDTQSFLQLCWCLPTRLFNSSLFSHCKQISGV